MTSKVFSSYHHSLTLLGLYVFAKCQKANIGITVATKYFRYLYSTSFIFEIRLEKSNTNKGYIKSAILPSILGVCNSII